MQNLNGLVLGKYRFIGKLVEGDMTVVYEAFDQRLKRTVTITLLKRDMLPPALTIKIHKRYAHEVKNLRRLKHPNIVAILDHGQYNGAPYMVVEDTPGLTLKDRIAGRQISCTEAARLLLPVAHALEYTHKRGIIHRDLKPENILLTEEGKVMLTNFGISKVFEGKETSALAGAEIALGTPEYMSPEQCLNSKVGPSSDIYSLGIIFFELVAGCKPYTGSSPMEIVVKQARDPLPDVRSFAPNLSEPAIEFIQAALVKDPAGRFANMKTVVIHLEDMAAAGGCEESGIVHFGETEDAPELTGVDSLLAQIPPDPDPVALSAQNGTPIHDPLSPGVLSQPKRLLRRRLCRAEI